MSGHPPDEGIGLLTGEEAAAPAVPKSSHASAAAPTPAAPPAPVMPAKKEISGLLTLKAADDTVREVTADTETTLSAVLTNVHTESGTVQLTVEIHYDSIYPGEGAEWPVHWLPPGKKSFVELVRKKESTNVPVTPGAQVPVTFKIKAPSGVRFRDRVEIRLAATWNDDAKPSATLTLACSARQSVLAIKSARGYETEVADTLFARGEEKPDVVFALLVPSGLRGYVFAEGMSFEGVREMLHGIRKARGLVAGETTLKEVEPLLLPRITVEGFVEGAIVELIAGPFKGEKARVKKIDQGKEEITVELIEAVVPIPVTVRGDHVRMLEKGGGKSGG